MNKEELRRYSESYAKSQGYKLNPDEKIVETVINGLLENERRYGFRYCPCRVVTGNKRKDSKIICPCAFHRKEMEEDGTCKCGLFLKG